MFYCNDCADKHNWPKSYMISYGVCEMCGLTNECNDIPCSCLPLPKKKNPLREKKMNCTKNKEPDWRTELKNKCIRKGWRCKVRERGNKFYARILDWKCDNDIQSILSTVKEDWPYAKITSGFFPIPNSLWVDGDVTLRLNP